MIKEKRTGYKFCTETFDIATYAQILFLSIFQTLPFSVWSGQRALMWPIDVLVFRCKMFIVEKRSCSSSHVGVTWRKKGNILKLVESTNLVEGAAVYWNECLCSTRLKKV